MIFSFGNLLSVFIVLVILIIYRQLDRNNRSLEKVKKYTDRIKNDIVDLVDQKTAEMKNLAIELDVNLKTGKEVLKRARESEEALSERAKGIVEIRARLDGYDGVLEELVNMTAGVEENLKRVQSESVFVDKVGRRITVANQRLENVEQEIGKVEERYRNENRTNVAALRDDIVKDTEQKITGLAEIVSASEERIKDFGTYVSRLEARGMELEREVMLRLTKSYEQVEVDAKAKRSAALNQFVASLNRLLTDADSKSKLTTKSFNDSVTEAGQRLAEHQKRLAEIVKSGEAMEGKVFDNLKELIGKDAEAVRRSSESLHKKLDELKTVRTQTAEQIEGLQKDVDLMRQESLQKVENAAEQLQVAALAQVEKQLEGFEQQIDYRFQRLEAAGGEIEALEKNLRELAQRTAATVKEEFAEYARSSEAERSAEHAKVEAEFDAIRGSLNELEEELTALKAKAYENVSTRLQVFEDEFFKDLQGRNQATEESLKEWQSDFEDRMEAIRSSEVQARGVLEKRFTQEIEKQLEEVKSSSFEQLNVLGARVAAFEATLNERLGDSEKRVEDLTRSVTTEIERGRQELDIIYQKQLDSLKDGVNERVQQITRETEERLKAIEGSLGSSREEILVVSERVTELQRDLVTRSESALEELQKKLSAFDQGFSQRSKQMQAELDARSRDFRAKLTEMKDKAESAQAGLTAKIDEGHKILSLTLGDLDKRVKNFANQTKIFERADDLKVSLESWIEEMKRDMEKLQAQRKEMEALETRIAGMRKTVDDVGGKLGKLLAERARVEGMDSDFKKLLAISKDLDDRIDHVYSSQDALQQIQAKIRQLEELEKATESRFERLEKKKGIVEATTVGVDKNFEQLETLEKDIAAFKRELDSAGAQLLSLKSQSEILASNRDKTEYVTQKIQDLDGILGDLEQRMGKLETAREWLAKTETRFESIGRQAQEQVRLLESILKADNKQSKLGEGAPPMDKRETVIKLAHLGWSPVEIARTTKLSRGEVELILELAPKK